MRCGICGQLQHDKEFLYFHISFFDYFELNFTVVLDMPAEQCRRQQQVMPVPKLL